MQFHKLTLFVLLTIAFSATVKGQEESITKEGLFTEIKIGYESETGDFQPVSAHAFENNLRQAYDYDDSVKFEHNLIKTSFPNGNEFFFIRSTPIVPRCVGIGMDLEPINLDNDEIAYILK